MIAKEVWRHQELFSSDEFMPYDMKILNMICDHTVPASKRILEWIAGNKMELKNTNSCDIMILVLQNRTNIFKKGLAIANLWRKL